MGQPLTDEQKLLFSTNTPFNDSLNATFSEERKDNAMEMMGAMSTSDYMSTSMISFEEEPDEEQKGKDEIFVQKSCMTPKSEVPNMTKKIEQNLIILSKPPSKKQETKVQPLLDETVEEPSFDSIPSSIIKDESKKSKKLSKRQRKKKREEQFSLAIQTNNSP